MRVLRSIAALLSLASAMALASAASAQECAEGRERMSGRCCWPSQSWSDERARCEGAPSCPSGLVEHGDACLAPVPAAGPAVVPDGYGAAPSSAPFPVVPRISIEGWPLAEDSGRAPTARAMTGRGEDENLISIAFTIFDFGWSMGLIGAVVDESTRACSTSFGPFGPDRTGCGSWPLAFVPVVGGLLSTIVTFNGFRTNGTPGLGNGITSIIFQLIGLTIALPIAFANETTEMTFQPIDLGGGATASFHPSAPESDGGLSMRVSF